MLHWLEMCLKRLYPYMVLGPLCKNILICYTAIYLWPLTYFKKIINIGNNYCAIRGRAFIFGMCVFYDKAFLMIYGKVFQLIECMTLLVTFDLLFKTLILYYKR